MITFGLVTPSFNQGAFLGQALDSVLGQHLVAGAAAVDYLVLDGGSTDTSCEVLAAAEGRTRGMDWLTFAWESRPDGGQYAAVNEGFGRVGGEVLGWLNADDVYMPWALGVVAEVFEKFPEVRWLTSVSPMTVDARGMVVGCDARWGYSARSFRAGANLPGQGWPARWFIQQDATFWRRELWEAAGGRLAAGWRLAADFELWARFFGRAELYALATPLSAYRVHPGQKTADQAAYDAEAREILARAGGRPPGRPAGWLKRNVAAPLAALPGARGLLAGCGLMERVKVIKHTGRGGAWRIEERLIL